MLIWALTKQMPSKRFFGAGARGRDSLGARPSRFLIRAEAAGEMSHQNLKNLNDLDASLIGQIDVDEA